MTPLGTGVEAGQILEARSDRTASALDRLKKAAEAGTPEGLAAARKAAEEFEAVFVNHLLESMFSGIKTDGPFGGGQGEKMFRSLMNQEYAKSIVKQGGFGIADSVMRELQSLQEVS